MTKNIGIWLDHKHAVIVSMKDNDEAPETSTVNAHHSQHKETPSEIKHFFDDLIKKVEHAEAIFAFGPGDAKEQLQKLFTSHNHPGKMVIETADNMTENQVVAKVRKHFN